MPTIDHAPVSMTEHWVIARNHPIFYRAAPGPAGVEITPIIHLHGFGISGNYLVPTAALLAHWYPGYVPDLPGYGRSPNPDGVLDIPDLAEEVVGFMDALGLDRAILLGNSLGCVTAIEVANLVPDRIERAILVSPSGGQHNEPLLRGTSQLVADGSREGLRLMRIAVPDYVRFGPVNALHLFRAMTAYDISTHLDQVRIPLLLVAGSRDPLVSIPQLERTAAALPNMMMVIQQGAAHAINFSHPRTLAHVVHTWLEDKPLPTIDRTGHAFHIDDSRDRA